MTNTRKRFNQWISNKKNNNYGLGPLFQEPVNAPLPPAVPPVSANTKKIVNKLVTIFKSKTKSGGRVPVSNTPESRALLEATTKKNVQNATVSRLISILKSKIKPPTFTQSSNAHGVIKNEKGRVIGSVFLNQNGNPGFKVKGVFKTEHNGWSLNKVGNTNYRLIYTAPKRPAASVNAKGSFIRILKNIASRVPKSGAAPPPMPEEVLNQLEEVLNEKRNKVAEIIAESKKSGRPTRRQLLMQEAELAKAANKLKAVRANPTPTSVNNAAAAVVNAVPEAAPVVTVIFTHYNNPQPASSAPGIAPGVVAAAGQGGAPVMGMPARRGNQARRQQAQRPAAQASQQAQRPAAQASQQASRQAKQTQTPPLTQNAAAQVNAAAQATERVNARTQRRRRAIITTEQFKKIMEQVMSATTAARAAPNNSAKLEALQKAVQELKNQPPSSELERRLKLLIDGMFANKNKPPPTPKVREAVAQTKEEVLNKLTELEKKEEKEEEKFKKTALANFSLNQLLVFRRTAKNNKNEVNKHIRDRLRQLLSNIRTGPETNRARKYNEILRYLPKNYAGRSDIATLLLDEVRRIGGHNSPRVALQRLSNLRNNIGSFANTKVVDAFEKQVKRAQANMGRRGYSGSEYYSRGNRGGYRGNSGEYYRGNGGGYYRGNGGGYPPSRGNGGGYPPSRGNGGGYPPSRGNGGGYPPIGNVSAARLNAGLNALPANQKQALAAVPGGAPAANAVINAVPGGQKAIIEAAEALNEFPNAKQAMELKGISPTAIAAVKKIAGNKPLNAISIVGAVNTLKKKAPKAVKSTSGAKRRRKPKGPRTVEIDRVLARTLKKNLASLVAHNITRTNNIKGTLKKYKKPALKILTKAQILRTKAANRARQSAKKQKNKS